MKLTKANTPDPAQNAVTLGNLSPGDVFRFANVSYEDALNDGLFYIVTDEGSSADDPEYDEGGRQTEPFTWVVSVSNGTQLQRGDSHLVVCHDAELHVTEETERKAE